MLDGEALTEENGKYAANFIIHGVDFVKLAQALIHKAGPDVAFADRITKILDKYDAQIRGIGFACNDRPKSDLWRLLVPLVIREATGKVRSLSGLDCPAYPPRSDGGCGWFWIEELEKDREYSYMPGEYDAGCNMFIGSKHEVRYYWLGKYFSRDVNEYFRRNDADRNYIDKIFASASDTGEIDSQAIDDVALANGIKYNLIEKTADGSYKWKLMFFTEQQFKKLEALISEMANEISDLPENLAKVMLEIYELYKKSTPKRLHEQIKGVIGGINNGSESVCVVCEILEQNGTFAKPDSEYLTKQIIVVRK